MPVSDRALRDLVRAAVARRVRPEAATDAGTGAVFSRHASQALLPVPPGSDGDGACLIEPAVRCNHCGFCQSYGH